MIDKEILNKELNLIGRIYGNAPVQAEGTIEGNQFYFDQDIMNGLFQFLKI